MFVVSEVPLPSNQHLSLLFLLFLWFDLQFWLIIQQDSFRQRLILPFFLPSLYAPFRAFLALSSYDTLQYQPLLFHYISLKICLPDLWPIFIAPILFSVSLSLFLTPSFSRLKTVHVFPSSLSMLFGVFFKALYLQASPLPLSQQLLSLIVILFSLISNHFGDILAISCLYQDWELSTNERLDLKFLHSCPNELSVYPARPLWISFLISLHILDILHGPQNLLMQQLIVALAQFIKLFSSLISFMVMNNLIFTFKDLEKSLRLLENLYLQCSKVINWPSLLMWIAFL